MTPSTEQDIQRSILDYLRLKKYLAVKVNNGGSGSRTASTARQKGVSDILACSPGGHFTAIEVKAPGGRATPEQEAFLEDVRDHGGTAIFARSLDDVMVMIP